MDNLKKLQEQADKMLSGLSEAMQLAHKTIESLPIEAKLQVPTAQSEVSAIMDKVKNGDMSGLTNMLDKYAKQVKDAGSTTK